MTSAILWTPQARRQLDRLSPRDQDRIVAALDTYAATGHGDVKKLAAQEDPTWRLRVGDWLVFLTRAHADDRPALVVAAIANRRDAYRG
ncbi:MAG TPA: type II toxin-antitoxin system RelE/ParE family toxin [Chloroflexota bacterium]|nr:type II toxin-antitoxin system RelE/ParE family toxin [Chloroflexota bacterium]